MSVVCFCQISWAFLGSHLSFEPPEKFKCSYRSFPRKSFVRFRRWSHCRWAALSLVLVCLFDHKLSIFQKVRCHDLCGSLQRFYRLYIRNHAIALPCMGWELRLVGLGTKCHTHLRCVIKPFEHSEAFSVHDARRMWPGIIDGKKDAHSYYLVQSGFMTLLFLVHSAQVERIRGQLDAVTDARGLQQLMRHLPLILLAWWRCRI